MLGVVTALCQELAQLPVNSRIITYIYIVMIVRF